MDKKTNPYFKNPRAPYVAENEAEFVPFFLINMLWYPCVHRNLQNMKNFVSEIFKRTRSGKPGVEEASHIEGYFNPNIQENYNLTPKISPVDYADMLLPITIKYSG